MISTNSQTGDVNLECIYRLLLDIKQQDALITEMLQLLRAKEFMGVNLFISSITNYNQSLYLNLFAKISKILRNDGYLFMITISQDFTLPDNIDYYSMSLFVDRIIFLQDFWSKRKQPPAPISNISVVKPFIESITSKVSSQYISLGKPLIGYDWDVPFISGSSANLLSLNSSIVLAYDYSAIIQLDAESQTPYYDYMNTTHETHKVWFIDANSIYALDETIIEYNLVGSGIWNITSYNQQLFSITNATFNIIKFPIC